MSKGKFSNKAAQNFLKTLPVTSVESSKLVKRTKFNFSFFDFEQPKGLDAELSREFFNELFQKLKHFSAESLAHWNAAPAGKGDGNYLEVYGGFPKRSNFTHPPFVPEDAVWGRFRLDRTVRLAGFTIPNGLNHKFCENERYRHCTNTFYVVFIDFHHGFYVTK
ncbi:hypothetical protein [Pseudomonas brassicacearum]|uniref:Uncharacterized protein n=1 Tax=Pseudomonas brassicacearum TaxID=930166 RepID=A0A423JPB5_9PSED|nr:hypothetical protein [Pseudomonas brassicacearum]RON39548.1 hypothetical protein BK664_11325 [Pseudomonas brassicacearum]